jgi:hypothetical protein
VTTGEVEQACGVRELSPQAWSIQAAVNSSIAIDDATQSAGFASLVDGLPGGSQVAYASSFYMWNFSVSSCIPHLYSINEVFDVYGVSAPFSIVVTEWPMSYFVSAVSDQAGAAQPNHAMDLWTGYDVVSSASPGADWQIPTISYPLSGCGPLLECDLSLWVGETAAVNGQTGIAQTGEDQYVSCDFICTPPTYPVWYEFEPAWSQVCFYAAATNAISADVSYSGGLYYTGIWDGTLGKGCTASAAMSMGAPAYAEWMAENPLSGNTNYNTPDFTNILLQDLGVGTNGNLLSLTHYNWNSAQNVGLGPLTYLNASCAAYWSCFSLYYT